MTDLTKVDTAVLKAEKGRTPAFDSKGDKAERRPASSAPKPAPTFPVSTRSVNKNEAGGFDNVNADTELVVQCSDGKYGAIDRSVAAKAPFLGATATGSVDFPFSFDVLASLVFWCEKYGAQGVSESKPNFTNPVLHTDTGFNSILASDWEKYYYNSILNRHDSSDVFLGSINAAEKFGLAGLLDFLIVAFSCTIRGASDSDILSALHQSTPITDDEIANIKTVYPWYPAAVQAK